jgi:hypothetical protein
MFPTFYVIHQREKTMSTIKAQRERFFGIIDAVRKCNRNVSTNELQAK